MDFELLKWIKSTFWIIWFALEVRDYLNGFFLSFKQGSQTFHTISETKTINCCESEDIAVQRRREQAETF